MPGRPTGRRLPVAWATIDLRRPPGREPDRQPGPARRPARRAATSTAAGLDRSVVDGLGISVAGRRRGPGLAARAPLPAQLDRGRAGRGHGPAGRGGRGRGAGRGHRARPAASVVVTDLQVAYLTLGRVGPIVTRATVLDAVAGSGAPVLRLGDRERRGRAARLGCRRPADHGGQRPGDGGRRLRAGPLAGGRPGRGGLRRSARTARTGERGRADRSGRRPPLHQRLLPAGALGDPAGRRRRGVLRVRGPDAGRRPPAGRGRRDCAPAPCSPTSTRSGASCPASRSCPGGSSPPA